MASTRRDSEKESSAERCQEPINWWQEISKESAIAGMPYVTRKDLHWIERIFWLATIVASAFYAINSCLSQWQRFRDNPIVYEYEYLFALRSFPFLGITLCTERMDLHDNSSLAMFNDVVSNHMQNRKDYSDKLYNMQLLLVLNRLHYNNLEILIPYENDTIAQNTDLIRLLSFLHVKNSAIPQLRFHMTEMGFCQSSSHLGKGYSFQRTMPPVRNCSYFDNCQITLKPPVPGTRVTLFIHDVYEVAMPQDRRTLTIDVGTQNSFLLKILLNPISAEEEVRNLPIAYRKCRYTDENNLKFFDQYHPSLCRQDCRISHAVALCNCMPIFYEKVAKFPYCSIKGMVCLARKKWLSKPCDCLPLCKENSYTIVEELVQSGGGNQYAGANFERTIIIQQDLPKMGIKRRVVFSTDQLIMSFGGAIGLFLGASFMTLYGLTYLAIYFLIVKCQYRPRPKRRTAANVVVA